MKLDAVALYSNNIENVTKFYRDTLGLELDYRQEDKFVSLKFEI